MYPTAPQVRHFGVRRLRPEPAVPQQPLCSTAACGRVMAGMGKKEEGVRKNDGLEGVGLLSKVW